MKPKKIIVVYNQINQGYAEKIKEWATEGKLGLNVEVTFLDEIIGNAISHQSSMLLPDYIHASLLVIALVGEENMNHPWRKLEKFLFRSNTPRRVVCRIPYTSGQIPSAFEHLRQISYNPNAIEKQIRLLTSKEVEKNANNNSKFRRRENTPKEDVSNTTAV
jgi:hypothetical protein